jgi:hypothetical protein
MGAWIMLGGIVKEGFIKKYDSFKKDIFSMRKCVVKPLESLVSKRS